MKTSLFCAPKVNVISSVVDSDIDAAKIVQAVRSAEKVLIDDVRVFDLFKGPSIGEGKKSLAITVVLQPTEKTLTDEEIDSVAQKVVQSVEKVTGGVLRS